MQGIQSPPLLSTAFVTPSPSSVPCRSDREIFKVVSLLLELGIAHNLVMLRGEPFNREMAANEKAVVRSLLIPRKPALGNKHWALNYSGTEVIYAIPHC